MRCGYASVRGIQRTARFRLCIRTCALSSAIRADGHKYSACFEAASIRSKTSRRGGTRRQEDGAGPSGGFSDTLTCHDLKTTKLTIF